VSYCLPAVDAILNITLLCRCQIPSLVSKSTSFVVKEGHCESTIRRWCQTPVGTHHCLWLVFSVGCGRPPLWSSRQSSQATDLEVAGSIPDTTRFSEK
jgi:hypothetical protein